MFSNGFVVAFEGTPLLRSPGGAPNRVGSDDDESGACVFTDADFGDGGVTTDFEVLSPNLIEGGGGFLDVTPFREGEADFGFCIFCVVV